MYEIREASGEADRQGSYRLRYEVYVNELGILPPSDSRSEIDIFDDLARHFLLLRSEEIIGTFRTIDSKLTAGRLSPTAYIGRRFHDTLELSRFAIVPEFRDTLAFGLMLAQAAEAVIRRSPTCALVDTFTPPHPQSVTRMARRLGFSDLGRPYRARKPFSGRVHSLLTQRDDMEPLVEFAKRMERRWKLLRGHPAPRLAVTV